jgi:hypothetical protein
MSDFLYPVGTAFLMENETFSISRQYLVHNKRCYTLVNKYSYSISMEESKLIRDIFMHNAEVSYHECLYTVPQIDIDVKKHTGSLH